MKIYKISLLLTCLFTFNYSLCSANNYLMTTVNDVLLREKLSEFLDNVLKQGDSNKVMQVVDQFPNESDDNLYEYLLSHTSDFLPLVPAYSQLKVLAQQKKILTNQAVELLTDKKIKNCIEIGTPATYISSIKKEIPFSGTIYTILDKQRLSDRAQAYSLNLLKSFKAYDSFIPLSNYDAISEEHVPTSSVDLVICFIGLHHAPVDKLEAFIKSIARVLRPGGVFILRDHEVNNDKMHALVDSAHSIFNIIVSKTPFDENESEIRNFHSIDYWINIIEKYGFKATEKRLLQEGDSTVNTMVAFEKIVKTKRDYVNKVSKQLDDEQIHTRSIIQTFLTTPEWLNVDASQEYGNFINHTPFYEFPYFSYIKTYWKVFGKCWKAASKRKGHLKVLTSEHTLMNLFIGTVMTAEYAAKGLLSLPIRMVYSGEETGQISMLIEDSNQEITTLEKSIEVKRQFNNDLYLVYAPRYKKFLELIKQIAQSEIDIIEIAGQKEIQFKVRYQKNQQPAWQHCLCEYTWELPSDTQRQYAALSVATKDIKQLVTFLEDNHIEFLYCHDF